MSLSGHHATKFLFTAKGLLPFLLRRSTDSGANEFAKISVSVASCVDELRLNQKRRRLFTPYQFPGRGTQLVFMA
jgi:hypothetical protein